MWLKQSEETALTEGLKVRCWNLAPVPIYILGIENRQWRLARISTAPPFHKQSANMLLFCFFCVWRLLSLHSRAFNISADRLVWGMAGRSCLALLKPHSGVGFKAPLPFCWSCCVSYFVVIRQNRSWSWLSFYRRYISLTAGEALVRAGAEAVGLTGGCLQQVVATATAVPLVLPEQDTETYKKIQMERYSRNNQSLPFPRGRIICETDICLTL